MNAIDRRTFMLSASSAALITALPRVVASAEHSGPPVARVEPVTETLFGRSVTDPYRWMENAQDKDWMPFMQGQAAHARRVLDAIPARAAIAKRIRELSGDMEAIRTIRVYGTHVFVEKRPAGANNYQLFVRDGWRGAERLLIDPEARTRGGVHYSMNYWSASPDGRYVMYGMSPSGSEDAVIEIMEVATGSILPDRIDRAVFDAGSWLPDGSGFFFNRLPEGAKPRTIDYLSNSGCWLHGVGTDHRHDVKVMARGQFADVAIEAVEAPMVFVQPGSKHALAVLFAGVRNEVTAYVNSLDAAARGQGGWKKVCAPDDQVTYAALRADDIYLVSHKHAPRYKVLHVKASAPDIANARELVPQGDTVIQYIFAAKDALYLQELDGGLGRVRRVSADGKASPIALPFEGTISSMDAGTQSDGVWFQLQSWVRPGVVLQVGALGAVTDTRLVAQPDIDVSAYESLRAFATARDGTKVPVSLVCRKGLIRDGSAPTMLQAYGAYGTTYPARFDPSYLAWLERGGVLATAHVRGGGEYGHEWHEGGFLSTKHNTWGDMIAVAEKLIADKWTGSAKLAIRGLSAGGIAVGRSMTERPDLFAAVISLAGCSNTLREEFAQGGPENIPEFGSVTTVDGFKGLYEMDSYQHVQDGTKYPGVLLTAGIADPRVPAWDPAKMTARLQKATASGKPVLLRVEFEGGHGGFSTRAQRDEEAADIFTFALWQMGVAGFQAT